MGLSAGRYGDGGYARLRRAQRREAGVWAAIGGCADVRASRARGAMRAGDMRACGAREGTAEIQRRYSGEQASEYPKRGYTGYAAYTHPIGLERITASASPTSRNARSNKEVYARCSLETSIEWLPKEKRPSGRFFLSPSGDSLSGILFRGILFRGQTKP